MIVGVLAIPMVNLVHIWGYQIGWIWGFISDPAAPLELPRFEWVWQILQNAISNNDPMFALEGAAIGGLIASLALMILAIFMNSNKYVVISVSSILAALGVVVIIVTVMYNISPIAISIVFSPLGIFLPACSGTAIVLEIMGSRRSE